MTTREHIRRIFLEPAPTYALPEAQQLLGCSEGELLTAISTGDLATVSEGEAIPHVPWEEVALHVLENASQAVVEEALGEDVERGVPEFVRLTAVQVRIPRYGIAILDEVARRERTSISEIVTRQIVDLAVAKAHLFENQVSVEAAMRWPLA